jgi:hypothetical protein
MPNDLKPLVHVPCHSAAKLAFVGVRLKSMSAEFYDASQSETIQLADIPILEEIMSRQLQTAFDELEAPRKACMDFLDADGFSNA